MPRLLNDTVGTPQRGSQKHADATDRTSTSNRRKGEGKNATTTSAHEVCLENKTFVPLTTSLLHCFLQWLYPDPRNCRNQGKTTLYFSLHTVLQTFMAPRPNTLCSSVFCEVIYSKLYQRIVNGTLSCAHSSGSLLRHTYTHMCA